MSVVVLFLLFPAIDSFLVMKRSFTLWIGLRLFKWRALFNDLIDFFVFFFFFCLAKHDDAACKVAVSVQSHSVASSGRFAQLLVDLALLAAGYSFFFLFVYIHVVCVSRIYEHNFNILFRVQRQRKKRKEKKSDGKELKCLNEFFKY